MYVDYSIYPRPESIHFFEKAISNHSSVIFLNKTNYYYYCIHRENKSFVNALVLNLYTIGLADYIEFIDLYPNTDAIITISNWNGYTIQAKEEARKNGVGIFVMSEFLGALNWDEPYKYVKYDSDGNPIHFGHR